MGLPTVKIGDGIYTAANVFSAEECRRCIERGESIGFEWAPSFDIGGATRDNDRAMLYDEDLAAEIWARIKSLLPASVHTRAVGLNRQFKFYRYDVGHKYTLHFDGAFHSPTGAASRLTFILYLNDGYEGGETIVSGITIAPETGKVLVFEQQLLHESVELRRGRKYVLRSEVMFR